MSSILSAVGDLLVGLGICWFAMQLLKVVWIVLSAVHGLMSREFALFRAHREFDKIQMRADPGNTGAHLLECEVMWRTKMKVGNE